jgi:diguanylate cyclase (GGDEF)-like protein
VTERRALEQNLQRAAVEDALTHLANRTLFTDRLLQAVGRAERLGSTIAVLVADLDGFKEINDTMGHDAGDAVLVEIARRLQACARPGDTVARLGADEFGILLEDLTDQSSAEVIANHLLDCGREPIDVCGSAVRLGFSIGLAVSDAGTPAAADVLRNADTAMHAAKATGRGRMTAFEPAMHTRVQHHLLLASELETALEQGQFEVFYQPTYSLTTGDIQGAEALVRWHHPDRGLVLPGEFIAVAEQSNQIVRLGRWVLAQACVQAVQWQQEYPSPTPRYVSVNLSGRQLADPDIVRTVRAVLTGSGLDPSLLVLEITESVLMEDVDVAVARLHALRELGIRLAVDDFGTGYSSLAYLRQFQVDILKIDRMFTEAVGSGAQRGEALARAIIDMAASLNLSTVAEGVEDRNQEDRLRAMGCAVAQGFLFARPMRADDFDAMLAAQSSCLSTA